MAVGHRIDEGFSTTIDFVDSNIGGVVIWEKKVKPPGLVGGGANDTTTMRNNRWRTKNPKKLLDLSEMTVSVAYSVDAYTELLAALQQNQRIIISWPDGSQYTFWGWADEFSPGDVVEGAQPEAEFKVIPSNQDEYGTETDPELVLGW